VLCSLVFAEAKINHQLVDARDCRWWALNMFVNVTYVEMPVKSSGGLLIAAILQFLGLVFNAGQPLGRRHPNPKASSQTWGVLRSQCKAKTLTTLH